MSFLQELKRRHVYKVAAAYVVVAWLITQVVTQTFPFFEIPNWAVRLVVLLLGLGFPVALVLAWAYDITPAGVQRAQATGEAGPAPSARGSRLWLYVVLVGLAVSLGLFFLGRATAPRGAEAPAITEKSVAVLPFESLSEDKANAYFADGIQDEIITRLAKVEELKVISRTSTLNYREKRPKMEEIGRQLGVAYLVEGSIQKAGSRVRMNVQLIEAPTDRHLWAESFDRELHDIFAVESELAEKIARSLQATLSGREEEEIAARPTSNPEAYDAFLRGLASWNTLNTSLEGMRATTAHFARAVELDSRFALAWAYLSASHTIYYAEADRSPAQLARAREAVDRAVALNPNLGEVAFARGLYEYRGRQDYEKALEFLGQASAQGSNRVAALEFMAYVKRRQGKWEEALEIHRRTLDLDPRNIIILSEAAVTFRALRRFEEQRAMLDRALALEPANTVLLTAMAESHAATGDLNKTQEFLARIPAGERNSDSEIIAGRVLYHFYLRDYRGALDALREALDTTEISRAERAVLGGWVGLVLASQGQKEAARPHLLKARGELQEIQDMETQPTYVARELIIIAAFLGDEETVKREAAYMQPVLASDALEGPLFAWSIAVAHAHLGQTEAALDQLAETLRVPGELAVTRELLKLDPLWDPIRSDPRFKKLTEEPADAAAR